MKCWIVIGMLALASCGDDGSAEPGYRARKEAEDQRRMMMAEQERAMEIARAKERETAELKARIDAIIAERERLDLDIVMAETDLRAALSEAERAAAQAKISELRKHQKELQERLDKLKAGVKLKCPPDNPLC